jgi:hypothetical protein
MDEAVFWLVVLGVPSAAFLAGWGLSRVPRLVRGWRYDWAHAKHLVSEVVVEEPPDQGVYGSMILAEEIAARGREIGIGAAVLERTRAELAPEALAEEVMPADPRWPAPGPGQEGPPISSGPGVCPPNDDAPGPDPSGCAVPSSPKSASAALDNENQGSGHLASHGGDVQGWDVEVRAFESSPAARADLTGSLSPHHEDDPGRLARGWPGLTRLADTGDIMDAALAADVAAYQRAQDDQVRAWCSGWEAERREFTRHLAEAWA